MARRATARERARRPTEGDYARLLAVRTALRRFERWSAERAADNGLTASQHQLLLAIRGHGDELGPTISEVADYLFIRHHSAVELVDRTEKARLVHRARDADDHRVVHLTLSPAGEQVIADLSSAHLEELARLRPVLESILGTLNPR